MTTTKKKSPEKSKGGTEKANNDHTSNDKNSTKVRPSIILPSVTEEGGEVEHYGEKMSLHCPYRHWC